MRVNLREPLFAKFGFIIYRRDVKDSFEALIAHHPLALVVIATSITILVLVFAGGIKSSILVYVILGVPVAGCVLIVLLFVMEMKVKTLLPVLCVLVALFLASGNSSMSE